MAREHIAHKFEPNRRRWRNLPNGELRAVGDLHPWSLKLCEASWIREESGRRILAFQRELALQRWTPGYNGLKRPCHTGLVDARGDRVIRTLPSKTQVEALFNYIDLIGDEDELTILLLSVAIPSIRAAFDTHHRDLLLLVKLNGKAENCRVLNQEIAVPPLQVGGWPIDPSAIPPQHRPRVSDMPWHFLTAAIRFGQAQLCGAGAAVFDDILRQLMDDRKFLSSRTWNRRLGFDNMRIDNHDIDFEAATPANPRQCPFGLGAPYMRVRRQHCQVRGCLALYTDLLKDASDTLAPEDFTKDFMILNRYDVWIETGQENNTCAICLDNFRPRDLFMAKRVSERSQCHLHIFHYHCYRNWCWNSAGRFPKCPLCRRRSRKRIDVCKTYQTLYRNHRRTHAGHGLGTRHTDPDA